MEKISISNIVSFRRKSPNSQITFVKGLKDPKPKSQSGEGGDYWVSSVSAISRAFSKGNVEDLVEKIDELREKSNNSPHKISKDMFQRNIAILKNFEGFKFGSIRPKTKLTYFPKNKDKSIVIIKELPVQILPNHVYSFKENDKERLSAVWFVSKLGGYTNEELAMFTDALYRYLLVYYNGDFEIDPHYCIAVDVTTQNKIRYIQILKKEVPSILNSSLELINKILNKK